MKIREYTRKLAVCSVDFRATGFFYESKVRGGWVGQSNEGKYTPMPIAANTTKGKLWLSRL